MLVTETSETKLQKSRSSSSLRKSLERLTHHLLAQQPVRSSDIFFQIFYLLLTDLLMSDHTLDKNNTQSVIAIPSTNLKSSLI